MSDPHQCPSCGQRLAGTDVFCEACGAAINASAPAAETAPPSKPAIAPPSTPSAPACRECGGTVMTDGFCDTCGYRAPSPRDHWSERPAAGVAGVCDKGVEHARNEDAMALSALADGSMAVLVVCDGVTSAPESDKASLAASRAACAHLVSAPAPPPGSSAAALVDLDARQLEGAAAAAHAAAVGVSRTLGDPVEPPSSTFVAAVVRPGLVSVAWVGDSRAYWLPDEGTAEQLTADHSVGTELVLAGRTRAEAESDPAFHTITRWLGADSVEPAPEVISHPLDGSGWVVLCSDGLWNYASEPATFAAVVTECRQRVGDDLLAVCDELVRWANAQGGHDNITVAVAEHPATASTATAPTGTLPSGG